MLLELYVRQSQMGGLMFRGKYRLNCGADSLTHHSFSYKGKNDEGQQVFKFRAEALTPSETETTEVDIEFDFHIFNFWVDEVRVIIDGEPDSIFQVEHLGRA